MNKKPKTYPQYLKANEAAIFCGFSRRFLSQLAAEGKIPVHKVSARCHCFLVEDLRNFMESCRVGGEVSK